MIMETKETLQTQIDMLYELSKCDEVYVMKTQRNINKMIDNILIKDVCEKFDIKEIKHFFDVKPIAAPRMTQRDKWAHRKCVDNYYNYRNELFALAYSQGYSIQYKLNIIFVLPYPGSWSEKRKVENYLTPCLVKPDIDNLIKAFLDALKKQDQEVWAVNAIKIYSESGCVLIF